MEHMAMLHALVCVHALLDATAFLLLLLPVYILALVLETTVYLINYF